MSLDLVLPSTGHDVIIPAACESLCGGSRKKRKSVYFRETLFSGTVFSYSIRLMLNSMAVIGLSWNQKMTFLSFKVFSRSFLKKGTPLQKCMCAFEAQNRHWLQESWRQKEQENPFISGRRLFSYFEARFLAWPIDPMAITRRLSCSQITCLIFHSFTLCKKIETLGYRYICFDENKEGTHVWHVQPSSALSGFVKRDLC
jgi:hypothetical protein